MRPRQITNAEEDIVEETSKELKVERLAHLGIQSFSYVPIPDYHKFHSVKISERRYRKNFLEEIFTTLVITQSVGS